jgi:hypothetical protein
MAQELGEHGQGFISEILIDKWLLARKGFGGTAGGLPLIFFIGVDNFWIEFRHGSQSALLLAVHSIIRLTENELPRRCAVTQIQPVQDSRFPHPVIDRSSGSSCVNASNHEIHVRGIRDVLDFRLYAPPIQSPERVDPVSQDNGFGKTNLSSAERLTHTVRFTHRVRVNDSDSESSGMTKGKQCLVEIRKPGD